MRKFFNKLFTQINAWSNGHIGILTLILVIFYFIPNPFTKITLSSFNIIGRALMYKPGLAVYQLVIGIIIVTIYIIRLRRKYKIQIVTTSILVGEWRNDWGPPNAGHEILQIDINLKYYILNGIYVFKIEDFKYNRAQNQIQFYKTAVRDGDDRKILNILSIQNNDLLVGIEQDYPIKYTRIK